MKQTPQSIRSFAQTNKLNGRYLLGAYLDFCSVCTDVFVGKIVPLDTGFVLNTGGNNWIKICKRCCKKVFTAKQKSILTLYDLSR